MGYQTYMKHYCCMTSVKQNVTAFFYTQFLFAQYFAMCKGHFRHMVASTQCNAITLGNNTPRIIIDKSKPLLLFEAKCYRTVY